MCVCVCVCVCRVDAKNIWSKASGYVHKGEPPTSFYVSQSPTKTVCDGNRDVTERTNPAVLGAYLAVTM